MGIIENLSDDGKNTPRELRMVTYDNNKKFKSTKTVISRSWNPETKIKTTHSLKAT